MRERVVICGVDPGLAALGWGVVAREGSRLRYLGCGTIKTSSKTALPERLNCLHAELTDLLRSFNPAAAAVEETFVNKDQRGALKLAQARGVVLLVPAQLGVDVAEYAPNLIKKSVVGNGHADKNQVRMMVERLLPGADIQSDHAADALAVAITHAHLSQTLGRWQSAVGAGR